MPTATTAALDTAWSTCRHHHQNSLLIHWLLICLALTIERLYRLRYLHRGPHLPHTSIALLWLFRLSLGQPKFWLPVRVLPFAPPCLSRRPFPSALPRFPKTSGITVSK
jgi:hypothetical protein